MNKYAILVNPGHNRVYFESSKKLSISEITLSFQKYNINYQNLMGEILNGIYYITFESDIDTEKIENLCAKLSFAYALFEIKDINNEKYFRPLSLITKGFMDESLSMILKYTGKTNELFTRLMINIAVNSMTYEKDDIKLLDPIAGKGTTLYEGLIYGYDSYGIEICDKSVNEAYTYFKKYLEKEKYKHSTDTLKIKSSDKSFSGKKYSIQIAKDKDDLKNKNFRQWELVYGNSIYADRVYKKNFFDIIVGDLPYGVQHGNMIKSKQTSITRNPKELVSEAAPAWKNILNKGGALVLAWNSFLLSRNDFSKLLENAGFEVLNDGIYKEFEHRVDQAIKRDIIVAVKP